MIRYARWDGGPIHVVKGILSSWPCIIEPDEIEAALPPITLSGLGSRPQRSVAQVGRMWRDDE